MGQTTSSDRPPFSNVVIGSGTNFAESAKALELNLQSVYSSHYIVKRLLETFPKGSEEDQRQRELLRAGLLADDYILLHTKDDTRFPIHFLFNDKNKLYTAYVEFPYHLH